MAESAAWHRTPLEPLWRAPAASAPPVRWPGPEARALTVLPGAKGTPTAGNCPNRAGPEATALWEPVPNGHSRKGQDPVPGPTDKSADDERPGFRTAWALGGPRSSLVASRQLTAAWLQLALLPKLLPPGAPK